MQRLGRWRIPVRKGENLRALSLGSAIPSLPVALPPIPLSWRAPGTWASSLVKCRAAEARWPVQRPSQNSKSQELDVSESGRVEEVWGGGGV